VAARRSLSASAVTAADAVKALPCAEQLPYPTAFSGRSWRRGRGRTAAGALTVVAAVEAADAAGVADTTDLAAAAAAQRDATARAHALHNVVYGIKTL
jgi:hypothetical protein